MSRYVLPNRVILTVNDSKVDSFFFPGGDVWDPMRDLGNEHLGMARRICPVRTGELRMAHEMVMTPNRRYTCQYSVINFAEYAAAVALGTKGSAPIKSNKDFSLAGKTVSARERRFIMFKYFRHKGMPVRVWRARGNGPYTGLMRVRHAPASFYGEDWLRKSVAGQDANNWIEKAFIPAYDLWAAVQG